MLDSWSPEEEEQQLFELVFEGFESTAAEDLQRFKAALLGELELSLSEAKEILSGKRTVLKEARGRRQLDALCGVLQKMGARVAVKCAAKTEGAQNELQLEPLSDLAALPAEKGNETPQAAGEAWAQAAGSPLESNAQLEALEQISDLFRDLEEQCLIGSGAQVLKEFPIAAEPSSQGLPGAAPKPSAGAHKKWIKLLKRWCRLQRVVSMPELMFSLIFSIALALISAWFYTF